MFPTLVKPIKVNLGEEGNRVLDSFVKERLTAMIDAHKTLFTQTYPDMVRCYKGLPEKERRDWPWRNASNLVVQIVGTFSEMLLARVMASIFEVAPLFVLGLVGDWKAEEQGEEQREVISEFINLMGYEQDEVDLYRNDYAIFMDGIRYGLGMGKVTPELEIEQAAIGENGGTIAFTEVVKHDGPRLTRVPYDAFLIDSNAESVKKSDFKVHLKVLKKWDLEKRAADDTYEKDAIKKILNQPDRSGPSQSTIANAEGQDAVPRSYSGYGNAEWDIYECHIKYLHNDDIYNIIYTYHQKTNTCIRKIFNFLPDNDEFFQEARFGYDGDSIRGRGFASMLRDYQDEFSTIHNQDVDAGTLANTSIYRLDPNSRLDAMFSIYPSACVPAREGEFEVFQMGRTGPDSLNRQRFLLDLIQQRSGVAPPTGGSGSGVTNPKKGIYSALGTFAVMQDGNRRTNINVADFKYFHIGSGRKLLTQYAHFGVPPEKLAIFGQKKELLKKALDNLRNGRICLPVRASMASINKEVEKQNVMLLMGVIRQHYMWVGNILQTLPQAPPHIKDYILKTVIGANLLMENAMRNFGYDDVKRYIPEANIIKEMLNAGGQGQSGQPGGNATGAASTSQSALPPSSETQTGNAELAGNGSSEALSGIPGGSTTGQS